MRSLLCGVTLLLLSAAAVAELPAGAARSEIETNCTPCHGVNLIERSAGYY